MLWIITETTGTYDDYDKQIVIVLRGKKDPRKMVDAYALWCKEQRDTVRMSKPNAKIKRFDWLEFSDWLCNQKKTHKQLACEEIES